MAKSTEWEELKWAWSNKSPNLGTIVDHLKPFTAPSALVTILGTVSNILSLSYFVTQRQSDDRQSATEAINKRLFILLNSYDVIVCVSLTGLLLTFTLDGPLELLVAAFVTFMFTVLSTSFITCSLAVIRAISITWPRHQLRSKVIFLALTLYSMVAMTLVLVPVDASYIIEFLILISIFLVVLLCNGLCVAKLVNSQIVSWKRDATITIGVLSVLYCTLNMGFLVDFGLRISKCELEWGELCPSKYPYLTATNSFILLPLNSACNPIIYFVRNAAMRKYLKDMWKRITVRDRMNLGENKRKTDRDTPIISVDEAEQETNKITEKV